MHRAVQQHVVDLLRHALNSVPADGTPAEIGKARDASVARMYSENPTYLRYIRRQLLDPASVDHKLLDVLAEFTLAQVRDLRAAGVASVDTPEPIQVFAVLMRELAPRLLEPLMQRLWRHLAGKSAGASPEIEIRIKRSKRG